MTASDATTPDKIAAAFVTVLGRPDAGGVQHPVGTIVRVMNRTPRAQYGAGDNEGFPLVVVRPAQNVHGRAVAMGQFALGKMDQGLMDLTYIDVAPSQAPDTDLGGLEDALWANRDALVAALDQNHTLGGAVTKCAETIQESYAAEGPLFEWQGMESTGFVIRVDYGGPLLGPNG